MPSYIGSYDGKGDQDNFLHLFEGTIRMQKWLMPVACHMFTYTLKDSARIWWNSQKAGLLEETEDVLVLADGTKSYPMGIVKTVEDIARDAEVNPFKDVWVFRKMVEFLGAIPINLKGNMWESECLVEDNIDWNKPPKE
ncbi:hypothetical protein Tco_1096302 [Tanacetum coccineum]